MTSDPSNADAPRSAADGFADLAARTTAALDDPEPAHADVVGDAGRQIALALRDIAELLRHHRATEDGEDRMIDLALRGAEIQREAQRALSAGRTDRLARHTDDHRHNVEGAQVVVTGGRLDVLLPDGSATVVEPGVEDADSPLPGWTSRRGDHPRFDIDTAITAYDHLETQTALDTLGRVMTRRLRR